MDNENKVNRSVHEGVQLFLKGVHPEVQEVAASYDLNKEYAKTRHNKTPGLWAPLLVCFAVVLVTSFLIFFFVNRNNERISVSVDAFEDLNLTSLLDTVSETRSNRDAAKKEAESLASELEGELDRAARNRDADLFTIKSLNLSYAETTRRSREVESAYEEAVSLAHSQYDSRIREQEEAAQRYQAQLDEYDSARLELAREKENAINSQKQLFEMEKEQLVTSYENTISQLKEQIVSVQQEDLGRQMKAVNDISQKYGSEIDALDPVINDAEGNAIVSRTSRTELSERFAPFLFTANLSDEASEEFKDALSLAESLFGDFDYTQKIVSSLPQKNSIPAYVRTSSRLSHTAGNEIVRAATREVNRLALILESQRTRLEALTSQNDSYRLALFSMARASGADGIVVSASGTSLSLLLLEPAKDRLEAFLAERESAAESDLEEESVPDSVEESGEEKNLELYVFNADSSTSFTIPVTGVKMEEETVRVTLLNTSSVEPGFFVTVRESAAEKVQN